MHYGERHVETIEKEIRDTMKKIRSIWDIIAYRAWSGNRQVDRTGLVFGHIVT